MFIALCWFAIMLKKHTVEVGQEVNLSGINHPGIAKQIPE